MKKIALCFLSCAVFLLASCASAPKLSNISKFPEIEPDSLSADRYIVLGEVSGESVFVVNTEDLSKEKQNAYSEEPKYYVPVIKADDGNYGFIGKEISSDLTIQERAIAAAEYKLIELARYNNADAVICVKTDSKIQPSGASTLITTKVSGLAIKIKADEGYTIEYPQEDTWDSSAYDLEDDEVENYEESYEEESQE